MTAAIHSLCGKENRGRQWGRLFRLKLVAEFGTHAYH